MDKLDNIIWKDVFLYEGLYLVSNTGLIYSIKHKRLLKQSFQTNGYKVVTLSNNGKSRQFTVHRLVAKAFILNPNNFETVNHIDSNKLNNNSNNLEWCTLQDNLKHKQLSGGQYQKPVQQLTLDGKLVKIWENAYKANLFGYSNVAISYCCNGHRKTHKGYKWKFLD